MKTFYISAIRSILECGTKIWHGSLTEEQSKDTERIQRRGMKIIFPEKTYEQALIECGMESLENRREKVCIKLINDIKGLIHKLNELLPPTVGHIRERDTRLNTNKFYNFILLFYFILFYFILQNSPYIRITITQQNLHTLNKCHTHNGWNDHTEMKSPITGFQYKT